MGEEKEKEKEKGKEEDVQMIWKAACYAGVMVAGLGLMLAGLSMMAKMQAGMYMTVFEAYDDGALLTVLAVFGIICCMGGVNGAVLSHFSANVKKLKRIQLMVYVYIAWGTALALLCFVTCYLVMSCSKSLDVLFQSGFVEKLVLYRLRDDVRMSIDSMQRDLGCCGSSNLSDWFLVEWSFNVSRTDYALPESCCDRLSLQARGLRSCVLAVPFGEATSLTAFKPGCISKVVTYFGGILNTRSLMIIGCGILQLLVIGLVVFEMLKKRHVYETPEEEEKRKLLEADYEGYGEDEE